MRRIEYSTDDGRRLTRLESSARLLVHSPFTRRSLLVSGLMNGLLAAVLIAGAAADAVSDGWSWLSIGAAVGAAWFATRAAAAWVVRRSVRRYDRSSLSLGGDEPRSSTQGDAYVNPD